MNKEELKTALIELRDMKDYSPNEDICGGYRTGILDAIDLIDKLTPTRPALSAEEILRAHLGELRFLHYTPVGACITDIINAMEEYRNQTVQVTYPTELEIRAAFKEWEQQNSHLTDTDSWSFENGVLWAIDNFNIKPFTPPRTPQAEAERLHHELGHFKSIAVVEYTCTALQLRGLSTQYEEEVLTILKSM